MNKKIILALTFFTLVGQQAYSATAAPTTVATTPVKKGSLDLSEVPHFGTAKLIYGALGLGGSIVALQKLKAKIADTQAKIKTLRDADVNANNEATDTEAVENDEETESNDQPEETLAQLEANLSKYGKLKLLSSVGIGVGILVLLRGLGETAISAQYNQVRAINDNAAGLPIVDQLNTAADALTDTERAELTNNDNKALADALTDMHAQVIADGRRSTTVRMLAPFKTTPTQEDKAKARKMAELTLLDVKMTKEGKYKN